MIDLEKANKGILLTDHQYRHVMDVADRLCLLQEGSMRTIHHAEELVKYGYLSHLL